MSMALKAKMLVWGISSNTLRARDELPVVA